MLAVSHEKIIFSTPPVMTSLILLGASVSQGVTQEVWRRHEFLFRIFAVLARQNICVARTGAGSKCWAAPFPRRPSTSRFEK